MNIKINFNNNKSIQIEQAVKVLTSWIGEPDLKSTRSFTFLTKKINSAEIEDLKLESIQKDLNDEIYTKDFVYNIYGAIANYDETKEEWSIDEKSSEERREALKKERLEKSMTFEEFWEYERKKITEDKLYEAVKLMYFESIKFSTKYWAKEFREFWKLPKDFQMEVK